MNTSAGKIVVAGHICLDIIPTFSNQGDSAIEPGRLYIMGPAVLATGGAVSNTGLALHHLGVETTLLGRVGKDFFGGEVLNILRRSDPKLAKGMIVAKGEDTSYTVVVSPPGVDRSFLHCPGTNDTFQAEDISTDSLDNTQLFHFGYPPIMQRFYEDGGVQMAHLFHQVQEQGLLTSLDMAMPDPNSAAGRIDWPTWLEKVLPKVNVFLPSIDEILFMLRREQFEQLAGQGGGTELTSHVDGQLLSSLAEQLLDLGTEIVVLKLGDQGLYLRTATPPALDKRWHDRELLAPCFQVDVAGTTGAGDSTIAGFLASLVNNSSPEETITQAVAVGACSVETADASSGILPMDQVQARIDAGWARKPTSIPLDDWSKGSPADIWIGPKDNQRC